MSRIKKVLIIGRTNAVYRPGMMIKYFADRSIKYSLAFYDPAYWGGLPWLLSQIVLFVSILTAKVIIILPMQHNSMEAYRTYRLAKIFKKKVITDFYISLYETEVIDRKLFNVDSRAAHWRHKQDTTALQKSTVSLFLNKSELIYYTKTLGLDYSNIGATICPLLVPYREKAKLPYFRGDCDVPTIVWWGTMGNPIHGLGIIAEAIRILVDQGFPGNFAILGSSGQQYKECLIKYSDIARLPNVLFSDEYSFNNGKLTDYLTNKTDLALGTFGDTKKAKTVLANKVLDASSFGIPCLTQKSNGLLEYFEPELNILLCELSPDLVAKKIKILLGDAEKAIRIGNNAHYLIREVFSLENFERTLDNTMLSIDN